MGRAEHERAVRFRTARRDPELTVVEGFHALKHALRFGAEVVEAVAVDPPALEAMAASWRRTWPGSWRGGSSRSTSETLAGLVPLPRAPASWRSRGGRRSTSRGARRPAPGAGRAARGPAQHGQHRRLRPGRGRGRRRGGADDRRATTPGIPTRCAAPPACTSRCPVAAVEALPASDRPLLAIDPEGEELAPARLPPRAVLAFGTERHGLSDELLERPTRRVAIPMREGVSSLNLATSVAAVLFSDATAAYRAIGKALTTADTRVPLNRLKGSMCRSQTSASANCFSRRSRSSSS